jgi:hypothetical protein
MPGASPNLIAYAALIVWPIVCLMMFRALGPRHGLIASILGGYLLLPPPPATFEFPVLPSLDKYSIPAFSVLAICLVYHRRDLRLLPEGRVARLLLGAYFVGQLMTVVANREMVWWGSYPVPGMKLQDSVAILLGVLASVAPFLLARALLAREKDQADLLWALVISTFAYSFLMLVEVRLSPQLNIWIYGYFQHSFEQMMRAGGFRPIVFLYHGLWVAFLTATAVLAAFTLARGGDQTRAVQSAYLGIWLMVVLVLCKSLASLLYSIILAPLVLFASARMQVRVAAVAALLAIVYPMLRGAEYIPTESLVNLAARVSAQRAESLDFRFDNEERLLERARERPLFGWGLWGRNHVLEANTGRPLTITDGRWIIVLGVTGWTGFLGEFGLLALPILLVAWRSGPSPPRVVAGGMVILAINLIDMIPNATLTPLTWLLAGALLGWVEQPRTAPRPAAGMPVVLGAEGGPGVRTIL